MMRCLWLVALGACRPADVLDAGAPPVASSVAVVSTPLPSGAPAVVDAGPTQPSTVRHLAAGDHVTCVTSIAGTVSCWGMPPKRSDKKPHRIEGVDHALATAINESSICALLEDGTVSCWSASTAGPFATHHESHLPRTPTPVAGIANATAIAGGESQMCALLRDGTVSCWGANEDGALGTCSEKPSSTPVRLVDASGASVRGATAVVAANGHTCALLPGDAGSTLTCWGLSWVGSAPDTPCPRPVLSGVSNATSSVSVGCATRGDELWCWGTSRNGWLGTSTDLQRDPEKVLSGVRSAATGADFTCAVMNDEAVRCWGRGALAGDRVHAKGELVRPADSKPVLGGAVSVVAGFGHACALTRTGHVFCWGDASYGQMGDGRGSKDGDPTVDQPTPLEVPL